MCENKGKQFLALKNVDKYKRGVENVVNILGI